ncbi:MAG: V-type ATP synthase subunit A, partial [bacterium]
MEAIKNEGKIIKVAGPLIVAQGIPNTKMADVVKIGELGIIGEIIELKGNHAYIQAYEETSGLGHGDPVFSTNEPLSVELGPGLIGSIYDGIERPLNILKDMTGDFIARGAQAEALDKNKKWDFIPKVKKGDKVSTGDILGEVQETNLVNHKIMVPFNVSGEIVKITKGSFTIHETIAEIKSDKKIHKITMIQRWPVRFSRPLKKRLPVKEPLISGQRIIDSFFTLAKGGTACVPGPFGSGKTVIQHQIAKWTDADIIVFVGCGERGNEMTDVLREFPELKDPKTGRPLMERTILIANTSNMPIAAREASVYTGATIAEYYRDMGYNVAVMADSTSRWAEALREMSGRLEEMPGEEGYPAYLGTRIAQYYERSGYGICFGSDNRTGSLTVIGSVSPPGGDLSEPVVQNTLRVVKVFWGLDSTLAYKRHYPAINWLISYSLYHDNLELFYIKQINKEWPLLRAESMKLLQQESELEEIVRLVGMESLSPQEQLVLFISRIIREDFLYQSAYDPVDQHTSFHKQYLMMKIIISLYHNSQEAINNNYEIAKIMELPIKNKIARMRFIHEDEMGKIKS